MRETGGRRVENTSHVRDLNHFLHELPARQGTRGDWLKVIRPPGLSWGLGLSFEGTGSKEGFS